jgi:hypothetical protein
MRYKKLLIIFFILVFSISAFGAWKWNPYTRKQDYYETSSPIYDKIVTVDKIGGNYQTITSALASITDNAADKRYAIIVNPGDYAESVIMKDYVDLVGRGRTNTRITPTSGTALTFPANKATVQSIGIYVNYGALGANSVAVTSAGADSIMLDSDITVTKSSGDFTMKALTITAGQFRLYQSQIFYSVTGATTDTAKTQTAVSQDGASDVMLFNNEITVTCDDTNDEVVGHETVAGSTGTFVINDNIIEVATTGAGSATGLWLYGTATGATVARNRMVVSSQASSSYDTSAYWIDSTGNNAVVESAHNNISVTSSGVARSFVVATGDTINSFFDGLIATEGYTGAGTVNIVSSPAAGKFDISGISANYPQSLTVTTEADISLTGNILLITGDNDTDNDTIDLQNGSIKGQRLTIIAVALIDADDTITVAMTDTTCTGCQTVLLDEIGDTWELIWTGSSWATISNSEVP